ncbi:unnamed protein product, partial [Closterium sp. Naga37s-1]
MLAEQHDSACQESERASSRANESSAADKQPSHCKNTARQREEPSESNSNKANREKIRRDRLNDSCVAAAACWVLSILHLLLSPTSSFNSPLNLFEELVRALERSELARADRGSILVDAVHVLAQLRAETSRLRGSAEHMSEQIQELKAEKSELREERARLMANKQQLEDEVCRWAASSSAQSTAATSAAVSVVSSAGRQAAATPPPLGFAP